MAALPWSLTTNPADGGICFCCRRRDDGIGYLKQGRPLKIIWSCDDHITLLRKALAMSQRDFDIYEQRAIDAAGNDAGQYLDEIGKSDLATLSQEEWKTFCGRMIRSFGEDLAKRLANHEEAPF